MSITLFAELNRDGMDRITALTIDKLMKAIATNTGAELVEWGWNQGHIGLHVGAMETLDEQYSYPETDDEPTGDVWNEPLVNNRALFFGDVRIPNALHRAGMTSVADVCQEIINRGIGWMGTDKGWQILGVIIPGFGRKSSFTMLDWLHEVGFDWRSHIKVPRAGGTDGS